MRWIKSVLPHIMIILAGMFGTFLVLDTYNPMMNFVDNQISNILLWIFCILSIVNGVWLVIWNRKSTSKY